jgi:hypothetical protein
MPFVRNAPFKVRSAIISNLLGMSAALALIPITLSPALSQVRHSTSNTAYAVQQINVPDSVGTYAQGINRYNQVVGYAQIYVEKHGANTELTEGFVYDNGRYRSLRPALANGSTRAFGINDSHEVVGDFLGKDGYTHGFLLADNKYTQYDLALGSASTSIFGVNDGGAFVGTVGSEGFVNIDGTVTEFYGSGTDLTYANAINNSNQVVGQFQDSSGNWHGFSFDVSTGVATEIDYPGAVQTVVVGINDAGVISGWYQNSEGSNVSFVEANGTFETVDFFGETNGINNAGSFVGTYFASEWNIAQQPNGQTYGYLATPHPIRSVTKISVPNATSTSLYGVNNAGHMVGSYTDTSGTTHGLFIAGSTQTTIDYPGCAASGGSTFLIDINNTDTIVGVCTPPGTVYFLGTAFIYSQGTFTNVTAPQISQGIAATGINDSGDVQGYYNSFDIVSPFGELGDAVSPCCGLGWGINDSGVLTEEWLDPFNAWESSMGTGDGTVVDIPGASQTFAHAINNLGDVVFGWQGGIGWHSAILKNSTYTYYVFDQPDMGNAANENGIVPGAYGINDNDLIVGTFQRQPSIDGSLGTFGAFVVQF